MTFADPLNTVEAASLDEFGNWFCQAKQSAFRLELLGEYVIPEEKEAFASFLEGQRTPSPEFNREWIEILNAATKRHCQFVRLRFVKEPVSDYLKFETLWGYTFSIPAGETVLAIKTRDLTSNVKVPVLKDFWLFDDSVCYLMEYDYLGQFLGVSRVKNEFLDLYIRFGRELVSKSIDIRKVNLFA